MNRMLWFARSGEWDKSAATRIMSRFANQMTEAGLPADVEPYAGWMRETPVSIEISAVQFPGSKPVWVWESDG